MSVNIIRLVLVLALPDGKLGLTQVSGAKTSSFLMATARARLLLDRSSSTHSFSRI